MKPLLDELKKYSNDKVDYLVTMFRWIDEFLDEGRLEIKRPGRG